MVKQLEGADVSDMPDIRAKMSGWRGSGTWERGFRPLFPELRIDSRLPIRIAVATAGSGPPLADDPLGGLTETLPPGSMVQRWWGSVHRCRLMGRVEPWADANALESWFRKWQPDVLYYPSLEDLEFGIHPVGWQEGLRISLRHIIVNAVRGPATVHERLLVRETMMAVGGFWPGSLQGRESPPPSELQAGLSWLVQGNRSAVELLRWKPKGAVKPQLMTVDGIFDESSKLKSPTRLAEFLLGPPPCCAGNLRGIS